MAIQAGKLLAKRLVAGGKQHCDYVNVPTTVFTPLEFGTIGLSEEDAELIYGKDKIEVRGRDERGSQMVVRYSDRVSVLAICLFSIGDVRSSNFRTAGSWKCV